MSAAATNEFEEDPDVFNTRFGRSYQMLHLFACRILGDPQRAANAVENCRITASRNTRRFEYAGVTYGNSQRNNFRGPSLTNFDLALEKRTNLVADRVQLAFRAEFFNVLNHTKWQRQSAYTLSSPFVAQITSTYPPRIG